MGILETIRRPESIALRIPGTVRNPGSAAALQPVRELRRPGYLIAVAVLAAVLLNPLLHAWAGTNAAPEDTGSGIVMLDDHWHGHDHSHDDDPREPLPGKHAHGHNPADHSHDLPGIFLAGSRCPGAGNPGTPPAPARAPAGPPGSEIDRPPCI